MERNHFKRIITAGSRSTISHPNNYTKNNGSKVTKSKVLQNILFFLEDKQVSSCSGFTETKRAKGSYSMQNAFIILMFMEAVFRIPCSLIL